MSTRIQKVIRASAGTGKTYRLSLEYIALLLRCRGEGIRFEEILVITFTRKATAEIRDRIFSQMKSLSNDDADAAGLRANLEPLLGRHWQESDRQWLLQVREEMLTNKSQVQISTIDAFVNRLFKSIISPYIGLSSYAINSRMDPRYYASLYAYALEPENLGIVKSLFERSQKRTLTDYEKLGHGLLDARYLFHCISRDNVSHSPQPQAAASHLAAFQARIDALLDRFEEYLAREKPFIEPRSALLGSWYEMLFGEAEAGGTWLDQARTRIKDAAFLRQNFKQIIKEPKFWNGGSLLRKKDDKQLAVELKASLEEAVRELADFLYCSDFLQEEAELEQFAAMLLRKYDELRFRDQLFGYDDIAWYTYRYLYDPELSLVEEDSVTNAFYEILTSRVRFLLIDEFQDTSLLQFNILRPLIREVTSGEGVRPYGGIIVVGDEKQSIYGWRGGERDLLRALQMRLDESEPVRLDTSYRSSPVIIDFVNDFFGGAPLQQRLAAIGLDWPYESCRTARLEMPGSILVAFRTYSDGDEAGDLASQRDACAEMVSKEIVPRLLEGTLRPSETAILARENASLHAIADILDEYKIDYVLESSHSLLEHRAIKPAIYLLRYLATLNFEELLRFFRSDYILAGGTELKEILLAFRDADADAAPRPLWQKLAARLPGNEAVQRCARFLKSAAGLDLLTLCKRIFEDFSVTRIFTQENDSKNIAFFLQIAAGFCHNQREFEPSPSGFVRYCEQHEEDEGWQQLGLEEVEAIRLLTIHKSKGLEFGSVFLFWPMTSPRDSHGSLHSYVRYDEQFQRIEEHALTYNLDGVLAASSAGGLVEREANRACIEELNAFYVAVTRARSNLAIYIVGKNREGLEGLLTSAEASEKSSAAQLILTAMHELLAGQGRLQSKHAEATEARWGEWRGSQPSAARQEGLTPGALTGFLDPERSAWYRPDRERFEKERFLDYKSVYINKRRVDRGNLVHHYLSFIEFDSPAARQRAARRALADYGSLLRPADIHLLIERVEAFITAHADYFSAARWERVFTEQTLYAPDGREERIDRMLLSDERREILIVDFKTGESHDQAQLDEYKHTVSSLPYVHSRGYTVRGIFLEVEIG